MRVLRLYLFREIFALFALSLVIITMLFMSQRIIQLTEWAINRGVGLPDMARFMLYMLPTLLLVIFPIVTLFSILLGVGRLSSDNEITAIKSAGISLYRLFPPVVVFALLCSALALSISQYLIPDAARASRLLKWKIVRTRTEAAVTPRTFVDLLPDTVLYVRDKKPDGELEGVMAAVEKWEKEGSWKQRQVVFAHSGRFVNDPVKLENELWLENGTLVSENRETGRDEIVEFSSLKLKLDLKDERVSIDERRKELDFAGMLEMADSEKRIRKRKEADRFERIEIMVQFHERLAWPLGCLALCFWAVPLGIQPPRAGRARAIVVSVVLSAVFYYMMVLAKFVSLREWMDPAMAYWLPDAIILVTGVYMLDRKNKEKPIFLLSRCEDYLYYTIERVREYIDRRRKAGS